MKKSSIQLGNSYEIQLGKNTSKVKVASFDESHGTWLCETESGKTLRIKDAARFLKEIKPKAKKSLREVIESKGVTIIPKGRRATNSMRQLDDPTFTRKHHVKDGVLVLEAENDESSKRMGPKPLGTMSALDAAHKVLAEEGRPMRVREITETAIDRNYCTLNGATPHCTINGGIQREIKVKGEASRFEWVGKGLFAAR